MATITKRGPYQWQAKVRRRGYPTQTKTFEAKREAEAWASVIESEMTRSVFVDRSRSEKTTLEDVIKNYIREVAPSHNGGDTEISRLKRFLRDESGLSVRFMATLKTSDFKDYCDRRSKKVSPGTVIRELNLLHTVIETVRKDYGMVENPISEVKRPKAPRARDVRFKLGSKDEPGEEKKLLEALGKCRNPWVKPAVVLALETAMRRSELLKLRWEHVDFHQRTARLLETKNGESRIVPLSPRAIETLEALPRSTGGYVLAMTAEGLKNAFERARKRASMEHFNFHDLRHEATSRLFERGWSIMEVATVTGHKDLKSLQDYTNLRASDLATKLSKEYC